MSNFVCTYCQNIFYVNHNNDCLICKKDIDVCIDCLHDLTNVYLQDPDISFLNTCLIIPKYKNNTLKALLEIVFSKDYINIFCRTCYINSLYSCEQTENENFFNRIKALINIKSIRENLIKKETQLRENLVSKFYNGKKLI